MATKTRPVEAGKRTPKVAPRRKTDLVGILSEIRQFCVSQANDKQVARYAKFFTEGDDAYGVEPHAWEEQKDEIIRRYKDLLGLKGFLKLGSLLFENGKYEEGSFAILFMEPFLPEFTPGTFQAVGGWLESGVRNWAHSDVLCGRLLSPCLGKNLATLSELSVWRKSLSKWKRRAVPVSMLALLKTAKDYKPLLDFVDPLMMDTERVVHQGLGWFLREAWKLKPAPVEAFLLKWRDRAPRLIFQYATEKMTPENKARFRRQGKP